MAAPAKIGRQFDFSKLLKALGPELKDGVGRLAGQHASAKENLSKLTAQPPKIDWAFYRSNVSTPGLVDAAEKAYNSFKYPKPEDTKSEAHKVRRTDMAKKAEAAAINADKRLKDLERQLAALKAEKDLASVTVAEALAANPKWAKEIEEDLRNEKWVP
ncbi:hypothetical protein SARC_00257 [Sphaeroforma arctica JP610]|uniref:Uncharacterized protein n=1 Tax=Sphaeroforma arctica JP610 TaxID=667725 RepID=A0A0L0GFL3_9EUKA|nr:hypothetical protein SARC_00257 [Sphaeroforma arctica JP610]KNC87626.1 hypothetical protein SARC_00257 [Sphaeroforma arctica JP610]|eukprot:XP_014161528.1 hypothetical protein SARC_00257 [Sphaeroforma arctica JP610]